MMNILQQVSGHRSFMFDDICSESVLHSAAAAIGVGGDVFAYKLFAYF